MGVWAKAEVGNQGSRRGWAGSEAGAPFSPASLLLPPGPQGHLPTPTSEAFCGLHAKGLLPGPRWKSLEGKSCFFNNSPHGAGPDALGRGSPLGHTGCRPALSCFPGKCPQSLSLTCPPSPSSLLCSLGLLGLLTLWPSVLASSGHLSLLTGQTTGYRRRLWAEPQVCQRWPSGGGCLFFPMWPERTPCTLRGKGAAAPRGVSAGPPQPEAAPTPSLSCQADTPMGGCAPKSLWGHCPGQAAHLGPLILGLHHSFGAPSVASWGQG